MDEENTDLTPIDDKKTKKLTAKDHRFLQLLAEGKTTLEAYYEAGFKGKAHAAYQLRSYLKEEMLAILEGQGFSKEGLVSELNKLNSLTLAQSTINVKEKLDILKTLAKLLPQDRTEEKPRITAIVINTSRPLKDVKAVNIEPIEVKALQSDTEQAG